MPSGEERYNKLEVWRLAHAFALEVYKATKDFPKSEAFGLTSQVRRAAVSIPANIVEGYAPHSLVLETRARELGSKLWRFYERIREQRRSER